MKINFYLNRRAATIEPDEIPFYTKELTEEQIDEIWDRIIIINDSKYTITSIMKNNIFIKPVKNYDPKIKPGDYNTDQEEPKCPVCGYVITDAWEIDEDNWDENCWSCGSKIEYSREVTVIYSATVVEKKNPIVLTEDI